MIKNMNIGIGNIDDYIMMQSEKPKHEYNGKKPVIHILLYDCQEANNF